MHGFLGQPEQWQWLEAELQGRGHTTRALALPRGSWDDEVAFVHAELLGGGVPTVLVGHSLGGALVRSFATVHPDVAFGLGTIAAVPTGFQADWLSSVGRFQGDGHFVPDLPKWLELAFPCGPAELATFTWEQPPLRGAQPVGEPTGSEPRVAILAEGDAAVPPAEQQRAAAELRAAQAWVPGGHSPHVRHPALVAELLHNWLTPGT
ncbi:MAG TPA: alpha/beta fold hydrolase [Acidimicrobiales bacterium]|nr:alpha/beta fold hydrolase [Acidimicrobiales bacterium]